MKKFFYLILMGVVFFINVNVYALGKQNVKFSACVDGDTARFILKKEEIKQHSRNLRKILAQGGCACW